MPDLADFQVGDLVLISPHRPSAAQKAIIGYQRTKYSEEHAMWTHAAIYVGGGEVCEALTSGVRVSSIYEYFEKYKVRVRRCEFDDDHFGYSLAICAMRNLGKKYFFGEILSIVSDFVRSGKNRLTLNPNNQHINQAFTCSGLFFESHFLSTGKTSLNLTKGKACPADLSASDRLHDVPTSWLRLPGPPSQ